MIFQYYLRDCFILLLLTTLITYALVNWKYGSLCLLLLICLYRYYSCCAQRPTRLMEKNWFNWFEMAKFVTGVIGLAVIELVRHGQLSVHSANAAVPIILAINIGEAVAQDFSSGSYHIVNGLIGLGLICFIPWPDTAIVALSGLYLFPLSPVWVLSYTLWNATFSYGFNYSTSTRVVLLCPLIISFLVLENPHTWLAIRCYSMMLNMILRAAQISYLYTPGESHVTSISNHKHHSPPIFVVCCLFNVCFILWCIYVVDFEK